MIPKMKVNFDKYYLQNKLMNWKIKIDYKNKKKSKKIPIK